MRRSLTPKGRERRVSDPVEESIEYLRRQIKQSQAALDQLEAIPKAVRMVRHPTRNGHGPDPARVRASRGAPIDESKIIEAVKVAGPEGIGAALIRAVLGADVSAAQLSAKLAKMTEAGTLSKTGKVSGTRYRLSNGAMSTGADDSEAA
jgi:hypothetical protein